MGTKINLLKCDLNSVKNSIKSIIKSKQSTISKEKINDILSLLQYLKPENKDFYINYLSKFK